MGALLTTTGKWQSCGKKYLGSVNSIISSTQVFCAAHFLPRLPREYNRWATCVLVPMCRRWAIQRETGICRKLCGHLAAENPVSLKFPSFPSWWSLRSLRFMNTAFKDCFHRTHSGFIVTLRPLTGLPSWPMTWAAIGLHRPIVLGPDRCGDPRHRPTESGRGPATV